MKSKLYNYLTVSAKHQSIPFLVTVRNNPDKRTENEDEIKAYKYIKPIIESGEYIIDMAESEYEKLVSNTYDRLEEFINCYYARKGNKRIGLEEFVKESIIVNLTNDLCAMKFHNIYMKDGTIPLSPDEVDMSRAEQFDELTLTSLVQNKSRENVALKNHFTICNSLFKLEKCLSETSRKTKGVSFEDTLIDTLKEQSFSRYFDICLRGTFQTKVEWMLLDGKQISKSNCVRMLSLKQDDECCEFLKELVSVTSMLVYDSVCSDMIGNFAELLIGESGTNKCEKLEQKNENLKAEVKKYKEQYFALKKQKGEAEAAIEKRIENAVEKAVKKQTKAVSDELYTVRKQLAQKEKEYDALNDKYNKFKQEQKLEREYEELITQNSEDLSEENIREIKQRKIVFVRDKENDSYKVFQKLRKEYPNCKIIDSNASTIDENATDMVVVMTQYVAHGSYWDARDTSKSKTIPVIHCRYLNLNRIFEVIAYRLSYNQTR